MKKQNLTQFIFYVILFFIGINQFANAQSCPGGQVYACRYKGNCTLECKCIDSTKVFNWTLHGHYCSGYCNCSQKGCWTCGIRLSSDKINPSGVLNINPNPTSNSTTVSFSLSQPENVSLKIFDMTGRLVATLADGSFEEGENVITWNASQENAGIYFIKIVAGDYSSTKKISVTK